jgi:ABC-type branched-subunit amino acid transport system ATPase component
VRRAVYPDDTLILEGRGLRKEFGGLVAVADVDIQIRTGSLHAIIGPNGAGKTTLFNLLSGNLKPTQGAVIFKGEDITQQPLHRRVHLGIGRSFQITNIFPRLTVLENVRPAAQATGRDSLKFWWHFRRFTEYGETALAAIRQLSDRTTVLLVEQNFQVASALAERYVIIEESISVHAGDMADLVQNLELIKTHLGVA